MFLFDDILLLTRVKKPPRKARLVVLISTYACMRFGSNESSNTGIVRPVDVLLH